MDPKPQSNAGASLASLSSSINSGTFGAPMYTPPSTPTTAGPSVHQVPTYTPPSLAVSRPQPTMPASAPQPAAPMPTPTPAPVPTHTISPTPTPTYTAPTASYQPSFPTSNTTSFTSQGTMMPAQPRASRVTSVVSGLLLLILLGITGLMYVYGSYLIEMRKQNGGALPNSQNAALGTPEGFDIPAEIPTNGFQVTESGINEPNFDQQSPLDSLSTPTTSGVNTDIEQMFAE